LPEARRAHLPAASYRVVQRVRHDDGPRGWIEGYAARLGEGGKGIDPVDEALLARAGERADGAGEQVNGLGWGRGGGR